MISKSAGEHTSKIYNIRKRHYPPKVVALAHFDNNINILWKKRAVVEDRPSSANLISGVEFSDVAGLIIQPPTPEEAEG